MLFCNEEILKKLDYKVFVHANEEARARRILKRDIEERGKTRDMVLYEQSSRVFPMHNIHVEPFQNRADLIIQNNEDNLENLNKRARHDPRKPSTTF